MRGLILAIIGAVVLVIFSCSNEGGGFFDRLLRGGESAVPVTVESVVLQEKSSSIKVPATLEATESVEISVPEDVAIERIAVIEGDAVNAGEMLAKISEQDLAQRVAKQRSELKDAKATFDKNSYFLKNRDRLLEEGKIDKSQYDNLESEVQSNEAAVEKIQQTISRLEERTSASTLTSPIAGVIGKISVSQGATVSANRPIMTVTKADPIVASFRLSANDATTVKPGIIIKVKFPDLAGESALARVMSVGTELDQATNSFPVKAAISNPALHFKSGMRAEAEFTSAENQKFFVIPEEALIKERHAYFVFTVAKGVAHRVQVIPSETVGSRVEIIRGLNEDDLVVVKGHDKLTEGTVVDIWRR